MRLVLWGQKLVGTKVLASWEVIAFGIQARNDYSVFL